LARLRLKAITAAFVADQIRGHSKEPRTFVRERQMPHGAEKGLLREFVGEITVAQSSREVAHDGLVIVAEQSVDVVHRLGSWGFTSGTPARRKLAHARNPGPRRGGAC
jgi:hypothetical protein